MKKQNKEYKHNLWAAAVFVVIIVFATGKGAMAQVGVALLPDTISIGEQTTLTISDATDYPSTEFLSQDGVQALSQHFDTATRIQTTTLTSFDTGTHVIRLTDSDSVMLYVADVEVDTTSVDIRDIAPIMKVPYTFWEVFRWVLLVAVILAVAYLIYYLLKNRRKIVSLVQKNDIEDKRTSEQKALQDLEELRKQQLWQAGKTKQYYSELTDIVRLFIENSTDIKATDLTSDETLDALKDRQLGDFCASLRQIFMVADLVKFAKGEPLPQEHEHCFALATEFVKMMWQQVKPQTDEQEEGRHE